MGEVPFGEEAVLPVPIAPEPLAPGEVMVELLDPEPDPVLRLREDREDVVPGVVDAPMVPVVLEPMELFTPGVICPDPPVEVDVPPIPDCGPPVPMAPVEPEPIEPEPIEPDPIDPVEPAPMPPAAPPAPPAA